MDKDVDCIINIKYLPVASLKVNVRVDGATDEKVVEDIFKSVSLTFGGAMINEVHVSEIKDGVGIISFDGIDPTKDLFIKYCYASDGTKELPIEFEFGGYKIPITGDVGNISLSLGIFPPGSEREMNATIYCLENNPTHIYNHIQWIDANTGKARIELGYTSNATVWYMPQSILAGDGMIISASKLLDDFELSAEYQNDSKWAMVETISDEEYFGIPIEILEILDSWEGIEYVYVTSTNTIYWCSYGVQIKEESTFVNVVYRDLNNITNGTNIQSNQPTYLNYMGYDDTTLNIEKYYLNSPELRFIHQEELVLKIQKYVQGEKGNHTHYVGIFEDELSHQTEQIYEILTVDGEGSIEIELKDKDQVYYIYEVDQNGNKILDDGIEYNKNKVEFSEYIRNSKIETDSQVVSAVVSEGYDEEKAELRVEQIEDESVEYHYFETSAENTIGAGEEQYINNVLNVKDIYQEEVVISTKEIRHKVTYETDEGGKLEGETEEYVKDGETSKNIPTPVPEEGYEFDKWVIIEDGEEIEVDPSTYVPTKDVTFIAKFKPIEKIVDVDTSDIQVWVYTGIAVIAVIGIVIVVFVITKNKQKENNN